VAAYFLYIAEEVRGYLAELGMRSLDEAIGRVDLIRQRATGNERVDSVDLSSLLIDPTGGDRTVPRRFVEGVELQKPRSELGDQVMADAFRAIWEGDEIELSYPIRNGDRTIGAALGGAIALEYGARRPRGTARVRFDGSAGQSFGAFLTAGVEFRLVGEANDYVGKGMGGGLVVIVPPADDAGDPVLAGNTCLYGATGGELYIAGSVGERFGVRNSGAIAVVEGAGDHCCEYMTGGIVVVLGPVGFNLGAGMTGGEAYIWDPRARLQTTINDALVGARRPDAEYAEQLRWLVERHRDLTGSSLAGELLLRWDEALDSFWHVLPKDRVARIEAQQAAQVTAPA
jgi:glutamate synthase domain-containing protein 3